MRLLPPAICGGLLALMGCGSGVEGTEPHSELTQSVGGVTEAPTFAVDAGTSLDASTPSSATLGFDPLSESPPAHSPLPAFRDPVTQSLRALARNVTTMAHVRVLTVEPQDRNETVSSRITFDRITTYAGIDNFLNGEVVVIPGGEVGGRRFSVENFAIPEPAQDYILTAAGNRRTGWIPFALVPCANDGSLVLAGVRVSASSMTTLLASEGAL